MIEESSFTVQIFDKPVDMKVSGPFEDMEAYRQWEFHHPCSRCNAPKGVDCIPIGNDVEWMKKWDAETILHEDRYRGRP